MNDDSWTVLGHEPLPNGEVSITDPSWSVVSHQPLDRPGKVDWSDAFRSTVGLVGDWIKTQRELASKQGLWNDQTGMPTQAGLVNAAQQYGGALIAGTGAPNGGIRAYHGSPYDFNAFDASKIGTGEGAQAYGHGLYFAGNENVARSYRDALTTPIPNPEFQALQTQYNAANDASGRAMSGSDAEFNAAIAARDAIRARMAGVPAVLPNPSTGKMYEVNINADPEHFLDWEKPLNEQSQHVQAVFGKNGPLADVGKYFQQNPRLPTSGMHIEDVMKMMGHTPAGVASALREAGIPGIRYLDQGSRGAGEGTYNHVVFDANTIEILKKYGLAGLMAGGAAARVGASSPDKSQ